MAFAVNKVILIGNIGTDLELKEVGETHVLNFSLATSEKYKKRGDDEYTEKTEWHRVTIWGKPAEIVSQYAHKGSKLYVEGQLQTRKWEKDGVDMYTTEVNVREFVILDKKKEDAGVSAEKGDRFKPIGKGDEKYVADGDDDKLPW